jgi:mannosyl-oligosaccharide alpha-1,2-mannosidase
MPLSKKGKKVFSGGLSITDSLDTLLLMGFDDDYELSKAWIEKNFTMKGRYSVFEIVIRHLGGMLSAYQLRKDEMLLAKAKEIGESLLPLFDQSGLFLTYAVFAPREDGTLEVRGQGQNEVLLSDIGSIQLEFYTLSMLTGDPRFAQTAAKIHKLMFEKYPDTGLYPERVVASTGNLSRNIQ